MATKFHDEHADDQKDLTTSELSQGATHNCKIGTGNRPEKGARPQRATAKLKKNNRLLMSGKER